MAEEKILLIEGDTTRAEGIRLVLEKLGHYRLTLAPTIEEALQQLKAGPFDLIMTNITIEKPLDGVKLAQLILMRRGKSKRPPVVIITQERDRDVVRQCVQAGVVDYIVSFDPPSLIQRVRRILEQRRGLNEDEVRQGIIAALERVLALPTISPVYTKIQSMLRSRESSAEDVARVVTLDQSITANLLRLSNSALFGFSHQIQSVKEAVALLGFKAVQTAIATASTFDALGRVEAKRFNRRAFWEHSIGCGAVARVLAGKLRMDADHAMAAGVLHDMGKVVLDGYFPDNFAQALETASSKGISIFEAEEEVLPVTHEEVGRHLAERWKLPDPLVEAIGAHNSLSLNEPEHAQLVRLVHVADAVCRRLKVGRAGDNVAREPDPEVLEQLGTTGEALEDWTPEIETEIRKSRSVLALV